jgi:radical SAM superfamily enzyme YgiQ (UPF0313 family)
MRAMDNPFKIKIFFIQSDFLESKEFCHPIHFVPPMTLKYAESLLKQNSNYEIKVFDCSISSISINDLVSRTLNLKPEILIVSVPTFGYKKSWAFVRTIKNNNNQILTVGIGPDISLRKEAYLLGKDPFDVVFFGEAERSIASLAGSLKKFNSLEEIKKFYIGQEARNEIDICYDLDDLPFPRFSKDELKKYPLIYPLEIKKRVSCGYIISSRGCRHNCIFCTQNIRKSYDHKIRVRGGKNIVDEIQELQNKGINFIFFMDDNITSEKGHIVSICNEILERKVDIKWSASIRIDEADLSLLRIMKRAGCSLLLLSVESGSERIIKLLNKTKLPEVWLNKSREIFRVARDIHIATCALFIIGSPSETREEIDSSIRLARELKPDFIKVHFFTPYPGSPIYQQIKEKINEESLCTMHHYLPPVINLSCLDSKTLASMQAYFYRKFILRPNYIFQHLIKFSFFYLNNLSIFKLLTISLLKILLIGKKGSTQALDYSPVTSQKPLKQ